MNDYPNRWMKACKKLAYFLICSTPIIQIKFGKKDSQGYPNTSFYHLSDGIVSVKNSSSLRLLPGLIISGRES